MADSIHIPLSSTADEMLDWLSTQSGISRRRVIDTLLTQMDRDMRNSRARGMLSHALYLLKAGRHVEAEQQILDAIGELKNGR